MTGLKVYNIQNLNARARKVLRKFSNQGNFPGYKTLSNKGLNRMIHLTKLGNAILPIQNDSMYHLMSQTGNRIFFLGTFYSSLHISDLLRTQSPGIYYRDTGF